MWRVELREVVMRILGSDPGCSVGKRVGNLAARASGARARFVEVVERVGDVERGCLDLSWVVVGNGSVGASGVMLLMDGWA